MDSLTDYRHAEATRKNNPPAKIAAEGFVPLVPKAEYHYSPRRPPELRFDRAGTADELPELLAKATREKLTEAEAWTLAEALRNHEPWLEWAGKREQKSFTVDPVALHIHERVSAQAILKVAAREDVNRSLFADPEQEYNEAVQFYRHDVDWSNRLILGDSLQVMSSLALREDLAGKVQMIYMDPPYGIKFGSNFQPEVGKREVKDKEADLTREPEVVKAYRDTWSLGIHSYLAYLRDRLVVARTLLHDSGSLFLQIGDENLHRVRCILDEIFGAFNEISLICVAKISSATAELLAGTADYILWFAKNKTQLKYRQVYNPKVIGGPGASAYGTVELSSGARVARESDQVDLQASGSRILRVDNLTSQRPPGDFPVLFEGEQHVPKKGYWKSNPNGMKRLVEANRIALAGSTLSYVRYLEDFVVFPITNVWTDTGVAGFASDKKYVVETSAKIIERCLLMSTDPGDLVIDPTCGSGTTAYVAEQWGRRWITTDTSRVAVAIARQRLLTSKYEFYRLREEPKGLSGNFRYKTVAHVTLKSIAQNTNLDPIFAKHQPLIDAALESANKCLAAVPEHLRLELRRKLILKEKRAGKKSISDADRRRWELPPVEKPKWEHWQVPFDTDPDYPDRLRIAIEDYRTTWRARTDEVNSCIDANAEPTQLVDQPEIEKKVTRVSGPFTVEAVQPPEMSLGDQQEIDIGFAEGSEEIGETFTLGAKVIIREVQMGESAQNLEAYLSKMVELLRMDGVRFPGNKHLKFSRLDAI